MGGLPMDFSYASSPTYRGLTAPRLLIPAVRRVFCHPRFSSWGLGRIIRWAARARAGLSGPLPGVTSVFLPKILFLQNRKGNPSVAQAALKKARLWPGFGTGKKVEVFT